MSTPLVSVVLPVFNAEDFLPASLESLLSQTYKNFELIVIDDGSKDRSSEIMNKYAERDRRIRIASHAVNKGLITTLNEGFDLANGALVARMDADDICYPTRIEQQVEAFTRDPSLCLCGTDADYLFFRNRIMQMPHRRASSSDIRIINIFEVFFVHPTVMFNKKIMDNAKFRYNPDFSHAEDYELFGRISFSHPVTLINATGVVVRRQAHDSVAQRHRAEQVSSHFRVMVAQLKRFGIVQGADIFLRLANLDDHLDSGDYAKLAETIKQIWMYDGFHGSEREAFEAGFSVFLTMFIEAFQLRGDLRTGVSIIRSTGLGSHIHPRDRLAGSLALLLGTQRASLVVGELKRLSQLVRSTPFRAETPSKPHFSQ